jgi:hypothetical protein
MFSQLKDFAWGKELYGCDLYDRGNTRVYLWERNGQRSLHIRSKRGLYLNAGGYGRHTLKYEIGDLESLVGAIKSVQDFARKLTNGKAVV